MNIAGNNAPSLFFKFNTLSRAMEGETSIKSQGILNRRGTVNSLISKHVQKAEQLEEKKYYLLEKFPFNPYHETRADTPRLHRGHEDIRDLKNRIEEHNEREYYFRELLTEIGDEVLEYKYTSAEEDTNKRLDKIAQSIEYVTELEKTVALLESLYEEYQQDQYTSNNDVLQKYIQRAKINSQQTTVSMSDIDLQRALHNANALNLTSDTSRIHLTQADKELIEHMESFE